MILPPAPVRRVHATRRAEIAFVTMVRNEDLFLRKWVEYYSRFVPRSALYILFDGLDQPVPDWAEGCQTLHLPHLGAFDGFDHSRWALLSAFASALTEKFATVVCNDVDELIVLDPLEGDDLVGALRRANERDAVISPFAVELIHRRDIEPLPHDPAQPILGQRRYARINATYCKPCITSRPIRWSLGGHYADHPELSLSDRLFLFHLRYFDAETLLARQDRRGDFTSGGQSGAVAGSGWSKSRKDMIDFLASFEAKGTPIEGDFSFAWQRRRIRESWHYDPAEDIWRHGKLHNRKTYEIPQRFLGLF